MLLHKQVIDCFFSPDIIATYEINGQVILAGERKASVVFDQKNMTSCTVDSIPSGLQFASGIFDMQTKNAYPMICGGISESGTVSKRCWKLEKSGAWISVAAMKYERRHFTLNAVNGTVIAVGGQNSIHEDGIGKVETFDYSNWSDSAFEDIVVNIHHHCTVTFNSTLIVVLAGKQNGTVRVENISAT